MKTPTWFLAFSLLVTGCSSCGKSTPPAPEPTAKPSESSSALADPDGLCARLCRISGRCKAQDGKCFAYRQEDCSNCAGCQTLGYCTLQDGGCVVGSADDCRKSSNCQLNGACALRDGKCVKAE